MLYVTYSYFLITWHELFPILKSQYKIIILKLPSNGFS